MKPLGILVPLLATGLMPATGKYRTHALLSCRSGGELFKLNVALRTHIIFHRAHTFGTCFAADVLDDRLQLVLCTDYFLSAGLYILVQALSY